MLALGFHSKAIEHRQTSGRLHRVFRGVYSVRGRPATRLAWWMAAVLAYEPDAVLSHASAAALWGFGSREPRGIEVSLLRPSGRTAQRGIAVHRRQALGAEDVTRYKSIPVTTPTATLVDMAARLEREPLEVMVNEAVMLRRVELEELCAAIEGLRRPGAAELRRLIDRHTFRLTRSKLERLFIPIALRAGLPRPETRAIVNGYEVDFWWPELGLVVETDGGEFHRTPRQQTNDRQREHAHIRAGLQCIRFSHYQVAHERSAVERTLISAAAQAARARGRTPAPRAGRRRTRSSTRPS